ncbi:MAG: hypothetical protein CMJ18_14490 [Phycisphaeraceae bacterium]|nr:hypothetical protein [Phycisphaeraceae bacterium]
MISPARNEGTVPGDPRAATPPMTPKARLFLWSFSVAMVVTAGAAFFMKVCDFFVTATTRGTDALASFLIPVLTYLIVAAGFFCLFGWAYLSGQFRDVEGPKYRMLQMQDEIDAREP